MKLFIIILFLLSAMAFGENQIQGTEVSQSQEVLPRDEACLFLDNLWYFTKLFTYRTLICPKVHTDHAEIEQCVWEEMKAYFSSPNGMEHFESSDFLNENPISFSAGILIGDLGDVQVKRCGNVNEDVEVEEIKQLLNCGLEVIDNKRVELKCRR